MQYGNATEKGQCDSGYHIGEALKDHQCNDTSLLQPERLYDRCFESLRIYAQHQEREYNQHADDHQQRLH